MQGGPLGGVTCKYRCHMVATCPGCNLRFCHLRFFRRSPPAELPSGHSDCVGTIYRYLNFVPPCYETPVFNPRQKEAPMTNFVIKMRSTAVWADQFGAGLYVGGAYMGRPAGTC